MKTRLLFVLFATCFGMASAQSGGQEFKEEGILIDGVSVNVVSADLRGDVDDIKKAWPKYIKKQLDEKVKEKDGVYRLMETVVNQVTDKRGNLIAYIFNKDGKVSLNVAYQLGYDVYINSGNYKEEYDRLEGFVQYFVYNYYNDFLPKYLKAQKKSLKVLKKEEKKSEKLIKKANKKVIKKSEKKLKKMAKNKSKEETDKVQEEIESVNLNADMKNAVKDNEQQKQTLKSQKEILEKLKPKIKEVDLRIKETKMMLIEVKSKMKEYK